MCPLGEIVASLDNVSYLYPRSETYALRDLCLNAQQGEFLGLVGATGAGKTTLCLAISGIVPQFFGGRFFGTITVCGLDTIEQPIPVLSKHVGSVFEDPESQLVTTSVENEVAFALENLAIPREEMLPRIRYALEAVRLDGAEKRSTSELSGGQKQRLAIAAALALRPRVLVLDEPTSQLDPVGAQEVFATVRELNQRLGMTIVMASQAAEEMAEHADRIALMERGRIVQVGTPNQIYGAIECLEGLGLRPPQVAKTLHLINTRGVKLPSIPVRLSEGMQSLDTHRHAYRLVPSEVDGTSSIASARQVLSLADVHFRYPSGQQALKGVSLTIRQGEYVVIVGQNGAGKTTLVKHLVGLLQPDHGDVLVEGADIRHFNVSTLARRIGYVAQNPDNQIFCTTVADEVAFALRNLGYSPGDIGARTEQALTEMGLLQFREAHPLSLPKGDRSRIVIAAILAMRPRMLIFDEPTTGQDYRGAQYILGITKQLHRMGKTIVVVTHHLYLMPDYAQRAVVMGKGTILLDAPIREAYHHVELLQSTFLKPPQAVLLAQHLSRICSTELSAITPEEVAASVHPLPDSQPAS